MMGALFIALGVLGGRTLLPLLRVIPLAALGVLLAYIGAQHMLLARDLRGWREWTPALVVAAVALLTRNLGYGFVAGAAVYLLMTLVIGLALRRKADPPTGRAP